jgi:nucleoside 2-deoxyribosyltransferase
MKKVYLCSRVAYDARPQNDVVAKSLRDAGFEVYVPHEQAPNNLSTEDMEAGRFDKETIFKMDFAAMKAADLCVVVGRVGKDCAWEIGWFYARSIPIHFVPCGDITWETSPMLIPSLNESIIFQPELTGQIIKEVSIPLRLWRPDYK